MRDDLGRSDVTKVRACLQRQSTRYSEQKSRRILVAGTGCIENLIDRLCLDADGVTGADHDRSLLAARNRRDGGVLLKRSLSRVEIFRFVQGEQFFLIRKQNVDIVANQLKEARAMPVYTEFIRQGERHFAASGLGYF